MKNQKGITLIALVITIIVLLILAGVSIAMLTGENGILKKAGEATTNTTDAEVEEAIKLAVADIIADNEGFPTGGIVATTLQTSLGNINSNYTFTATEPAEGKTKITVTATKGTKTITRYVETTTGKISTEAE